MTRHIQTLRPASEELEAAVRWYEERRRGLGAEFYDAISSTIAFIEDQPEIGAVIGGGKARRVLVSRFPYQVVYHLTPTEIIIAAIAHLKRRPNYWKERH